MKNCSLRALIQARVYISHNILSLTIGYTAMSKVKMLTQKVLSLQTVRRARGAELT